jgi:adenine-specific DNA-methyltransferase
MGRIMAKLDDLIAQVGDAKLRRQLEEAAVELRRRKKFGLVFEQHIPETTMFPSETVQKGSVVMIRTEPSNKTRYVVDSVTKTKASISAGEEAWTIPVADLLVVKPFGEPVYPVLKPFGEAVVRDPDKPFHTVINGENFHALQLLLFGYEGQVDCIYIDPPYNTGARDWKYNNDYVDEQDSWRHSKWLSMMDKRLRLARRLLKPNGVLIVTIDEHEVSNLGVLLPEILPSARIQMVTIVTNTAGSMSPGRFSRAEEYAFFCFLGDSKPAPMETDFLAESKPVTQFWFPLFRSRGLNDRPSKRSNLVYPIAIDPETLRIVGPGRSLKDRVADGEVVTNDLDAWPPPTDETIDGFPVVWPILDTGETTTWQVAGPQLMTLYKDGFVRVRRPKSLDGPRPFTISYVKAGNRKKVNAGEVVTLGREPGGALILEGGTRNTIPKSTWKIASHDARLYGTTMLRALLGATNFTYPKSPYATADAIRTVMADNPDGVILDFFAGSGTTLQSVAMLNASDEGRRRVILVTNNEVDDATATVLEAEGLAPGDEDYEARGICRAVTIPRVRAALTGCRPDGSPVEETYLDGTEVSDGFEQNATFFDLVYADPDAIDVGAEFDDIVPALWMAAGGQGNPADLKHDPAWLLSSSSRFAVLLDEDRFRSFRTELSKHPEITHVWLVTDSETAFARMREGISGSRTVGMLYRDYLRNFRVNVDMSAAAAGLL